MASISSAVRLLVKKVIADIAISLNVSQDNTKELFGDIIGPAGDISPRRAGGVAGGSM